MLTHLQALLEFRTGTIGTLGMQAVLVVPLSVVRKLSHLLKSSNERLKERVGLAADFLRDSISSAHPRVIVQSLEEVCMTFVIYFILLLFFNFLILCMKLSHGKTSKMLAEIVSYYYY